MNSGALKLSWRTSTTWRSLRPSNFSGSNSRNAAKSAGSNFLNGANCQSRGPSLSPSSVHAGAEEALDRFAGLVEHAAVGDEARALDGEHEAVRHLARPFAEGRRRLRAVERAVDLDRGQPLAGVGQLLRVRQALRIEQRRATARRSSRRSQCGYGFAESLSCHMAMAYNWASGGGEYEFRHPAATVDLVTPDERAPFHRGRFFLPPPR